MTAVGSNEAYSVGTNLLVKSTRAMYRALEEATGGGAPQPAESTADARRIAFDRSIPRRIALDGQAYTWTQYVEAYGEHARRCWEDAYDRSIPRALEEATGGGAPQPAECTAEARRIALDGQAYTWPQYVEAYGDDAQRCWDDALQGSNPRRFALDGQAYT